MSLAPSPTERLARARADLRIRGQGDLFGAQQHGRDPVLKFADLTLDEDLLVRAQRAARELVERDPELTAEDHEAIARHLRTRYAHRLEMFGVG